MIARIHAIFATEFTIALRNRWVLIATILMLIFTLVLTFSGSAPTGDLGVDLLTVAVASMTTLSVYLVPLLALLMAFDGIAGEIERGGFALVLTYPVSRFEFLIGKFAAHLLILFVAILIGFGTSGVLALLSGGASDSSVLALVRLGWSSVLLGATFLAIGYVISSLARATGAAAGMAIGVWIVFVVIYDLALLGALVADKGGFFTTQIFPYALAANPADAFRVFNLMFADSIDAAAGLGGAGKGVPFASVLGSMILWPLMSLVLAHLLIKRVEP